MKQIKPKRELSNGRLRIITYKRINTNLLTPMWIKNKFKEKNSQFDIDIVTSDLFYIIGYHGKASFYLNLENGRLYYAPSTLYSKLEVQTQATIFLEIIRERVEGFRRRDIYPRVKFEVEENG